MSKLEQFILGKFKEKFGQPIFGLEYFKGDVEDMQMLLHSEYYKIYNEYKEYNNTPNYIEENSEIINVSNNDPLHLFLNENLVKDDTSFITLKQIKELIKSSDYKYKIPIGHNDPEKQNELFPEVKKKFVDPYPQELCFIDDE